MLSLWRQRRRTSERKKQSEGKMAMIVGGRRVGKRSYGSSSSSSDLQAGLEKSVCLFVSGWGCPQLEGPMLYSVDLDGKSYKRRKLCRRYCREILGQPGPELDLDERLHLHRSSGGFRELTPLISTSSWPPGGSMVVALGSVVYVIGGCISNPTTDIGWLLSPEVCYFETNSLEKGWIPVPDMLNCRDKGASIAVEGKIYVFGGNELDNG
ncbi:putative F-box/kelch-repeat protein [Camellia lanceoleosa]|uniref:F-box/kelch-repeat protein n=1 Tax=Camellia lanceoleosa TaxID=1840588 RepID=A0ACC0IWF4_9ERIC|nr:putative F-box/kelch-repeat protein [Camellia lanceoleosa]